jgi:hypothetical protein
VEGGSAGRGQGRGAVAGNLYHVSVAIWDAWAVYDEHAQPVLSTERVEADNVAAARHEAISYAAYRVL